MAQAFNIKTKSRTGQDVITKIIVSDQDAHWLRAYKYRVESGIKNPRVVRSAGQHNIVYMLGHDIYNSQGKNILHINGNPFDFRRSNVTILDDSEYGKALNLIQHHAQARAA